jgi:hypothetical protein
MSDFAHFKEFVKITNVLILAVAHAAWTDVNCRGNYFEKIASWKRLDSATGSLFLNRQRNSFMPLFVAYRRKVLENALIVRLSRLPVSLILTRDSLTRQDREQGLSHTTRQGQCHKTRLGHTTRRGTFWHNKTGGQSHMPRHGHSQMIERVTCDKRGTLSRNKTGMGQCQKTRLEQAHTTR